MQLLGCPIPAHTPHAVSVTIPTWQDNIGYEEGHPDVIRKLTSGYPRFVIHETIKKLALICEGKFAQDDESCMLFPSRSIARRCRDFLKIRTNRDEFRIVEFAIVPPGASPSRSAFSTVASASDVRDPPSLATGVTVTLHIVLFPKSLFGAAKQFWQHTGDGVSSRLAEHCLRLLLTGDASAEYSRIKSRTAASTAAASEAKNHGRETDAERPVRRNRYQRESMSIEPVSGISFSGEREVESFVDERYGRNLDASRAEAAKETIRLRIAAALSGTDGGDPRTEARTNVPSVTKEDVYLYPSGMSAIYNVHRTILQVRGDRKSVQFGFPYTDTLKILEKFGAGCHFLGHGDDGDMVRLESIAKEDGAGVLALFCEFPGNPLLRSPDLRALRRLADAYGFLLVVDETIGNFLNVAILEHADVVVSSLTKVFSGDSNVMGGSAVLNPLSKYYHQLKEKLTSDYEDTMWCEDAVFLERNSRTFRERVLRIDANAERLCDFLKADPRVKELYYPKYTTPDLYAQSCRSSETGFGGLFSMVLAEEKQAALFFDHLDVCKGPSLGTNFTLACPYTILAHYAELDWAAEFGVSRHLIRVSVGLENVEDLIEAFNYALDRATETVDPTSLSRTAPDIGAAT